MDIVKHLKKNRETVVSYLLLAVPLIWWIIFFVVPVVIAVLISFSDMRATFVVTKYGLFQYAAVLKDKMFLDSLKVTFIWTAAMMLGNNVFGLLTAFLISKLKTGRKFFLALLFWPTLVSAVVGADITKFVFSPSSNGLVNAILKLFGQLPVAWLDQESTALFSIMAIPFFLGFSVKMIIFYTGLLSIPQEYYEAAELETKNQFYVMWHITLPLLKNLIVLNILLSIIDGIKVMGPMMLVTKGSFGTTSAIYYIYLNAFFLSSKGKACAAAFIVFLIIFIISVIQLKLSGKSGDTYE